VPIIFEKSFEGNTTLGVWGIQESEEELYDQLQLSQQEISKIESIQHSKRYLHWLGSRVLIRHMLNTNRFIELNVDENRKPVLHNFPYEISISHSTNRAAVLISEQYQVGVDIEKVDEKVKKIAHRFLNVNERKMLDKFTGPEYLTKLMLCWSAKESMFKYYSLGNVSFRNHLLLEIGKMENSRLPARFNKPDCKQHVNIDFKIESGFVLTWLFDHLNLLGQDNRVEF
jgi:4'-phosphopantetheinyl transferase